MDMLSTLGVRYMDVYGVSAENILVSRRGESKPLGYLMKRGDKLVLSVGELNPNEIVTSYKVTIDP